MKVKVKKLNDSAVIPSYAHDTDAGMDLTATSFEFDYKTGCYIYGTGLAFEIPKGYVGKIYPRSSVYKTPFALSNCVGVIDSGYRGEVKVIFRNTNYRSKYMGLWHRIKYFLFDRVDATNWNVISNYSFEDTCYRVGDRIAQIIIEKYPKVEIEEVEELQDSDRGDGGFGSTGK